MTAGQTDLWQKILSFELDDPDAAFTFTDRLARENGWPLAYALRAVAEYKTFMFLLCVSGKPLTPSDAIDQVWHLHLLYTESYWIDFCQNTLQRQIHHGPTRGGQSERNKFTDWYEETKIQYRKCFQQEPPPDLWPNSTIRFGDIHFQRVNMRKNWIIPKFFNFRSK